MQTTDRLNSLTKSEQSKVIERVFQQLLVSFGSQLNAKWQGIDLNAVYDSWANSLGEFSIGAIKLAVHKASIAEYPPNLGEFIAYCKLYAPAHVVSIGYKMSDEQKKKNKERLAGLVKQFVKGKDF